MEVEVARGGVGEERRGEGWENLLLYNMIVVLLLVVLKTYPTNETNLLPKDFIGQTITQ